MNDMLLNEKKSKLKVQDSAFACLIFVFFIFLFSILYSSIPETIREIEFVQYIANALLSATFLLGSYLVVKKAKVNFRVATGLNKKFNGKIVFYGFLISLICLLGFGNLTDLFLELLYATGYKQNPGMAIEINNFGTYLIYIVVFCVCPAIFEEVMFRGTILSGLKQYGLKVAVVVSAIIFTLMHGNVEQTVHQFIIGLVVGFIFFKTGNLWLSVMVHFFNNFISVTATYLLSFSEETAEVATAVATEFSLFTFIASVIFALLMAYFAYTILRVVLEKYFEEDKKLNVLADGSSVDTISTTTVVIDGVEQSAEINNVNESEISQEQLEEQKQPLDFSTKVMFALSGVMLILDWVLSIVEGFLR